MEMIQLYLFHKPDRIIDTQYGSIPYLDWLRKEKERIEKGVGNHKGGEVALFANEVK